MRTSAILNSLDKKGFAFICRNFFLKNLPKANFEPIANSYKFLPKDPSIGNRYRAYTRFRWCSVNNLLLKDPKGNDYFQAKEYNWSDDGGKVRKFSEIPDSFFNNPIIKRVVEKDVALAKETKLVSFDDSLEVGFHQIRYAVTKTQPSFSSPNWLHKDDEPFVFVHLMNLSKNIIGGDNVISKDCKDFDAVFRLTKPLESFAVNQKTFHAVTPLSSTTKDHAYRDILLVTFFNKKPEAKNGENMAKQKPEKTSSPEPEGQMKMIVNC